MNDIEYAGWLADRAWLWGGYREVWLRECLEIFAHIRQQQDAEHERISHEASS